METYIAILRGINVSGKNMIKMADLKTHLEALNFTNLQTYIQSGNLVFEHKKTDQQVLARQIEHKILEAYGFKVPVIVRSAKEFNSVLANNPFVNTRQEAIDKLHVTFLAEEPAPEHLDKLKDFESKPDEYVIAGNLVYLYCPNGYGNTKLNNTFFENKLKQTATTRNWKTVNKLAEMSK